MTQVVECLLGPEFKPQYYQEKKNDLYILKCLNQKTEGETLMTCNTV
jgi:hypothetical protein